MIIAISIGGSVFIKEEIDIQYIKELSSLLRQLSKKHKLFLVVGGGKLARNYINACREFCKDESFLDEVGIDSTRLNAKLLISALNSCQIVPKDFEEAKMLGKIYNIVVLGGTHPGHTTDAVTTMLAERISAEKIVIMTNVDGVYTSDPNKDKNAKKLEKITFDELIDITSKYESNAGRKGIIDTLGAKIIKRAKIPTYVIHGRDLQSLKNIIEGKKFNGTLIC